MKRIVAPVVLFSLVIAAYVSLIGITISAGCSAQRRESVISDTFATVEAARKNFESWDSKRQDEIVKSATSLQDGRGKLEAYRGKRQVVTDMFAVAYRAIALAMSQQDELSVQSMIKESIILVDAISKLRDDGGK